MSDHTGISSKLNLVDRSSFTQPLRAEFIRFCTGRSWMISLGAVVISLVLLPFAVALASHGSNPAISTGPDGEMVSDTYTFVHQPLAGDGTLTTRVTSLSGMYTPLANSSGNSFEVNSTSQLRSQLRIGLAPWAKAGIILEPTMKQGTDYTAVMVTGAHGVQMQYDYTHSSPGLTSSVELSSPRWLRITRTGESITGYDSTDGVHWSKISTIRQAGLPYSVQIGLFVTSPVYFPNGSNNGTPSVATANFDHTSIQSGLPGSFWMGDTFAGSYPSLSSGLLWQQHTTDAFTISGSGDIAPLVGDIVTTNWSGACIVDGIIIGLLFLIVFAASFATSEYRRGVSGVLPQRVLAAKTIVIGSLAFAAGTIATALAEVITRHVLAGNGINLFPQSGLVTAQVIFGTGLFLGLAGILVVALGNMLRRRIVTIVAGIVLLIVPGVVVTTLPADPNSWLMRFTPTAAFAVQANLPRSSLVVDAYTIMNGYFPMSPWNGLAVLAIYAVVALGTAMWLLRYRRV